MVHRQRWETDGINSKCMDRRLDEKDYTEITDGKFIFYIFLDDSLRLKCFIPLRHRQHHHHSPPLPLVTT